MSEIRFRPRSIVRPTRRFVTGAAAALALAPASAFADPPTDKDPVAARNVEDRLSIAVHINGKGPFEFIVDTGAERSIIASETADALALPRGEPVLLRDITQSVTTGTARVDELLAGRERLRRAQLPVLPRQWLEADGYLGLDIIDGHRLEFDFKKRTIDLESPRPSLAQIHRPDEVIIRADGPRGKLRTVDCSVDNVGVSAFLDTGAGMSVGNTRLLDRLVRRKALIAAETIRIYGVTGGSLDCRVVKLSHLVLPGLEFEDCLIAIADLQIFDLWGLTKEPALVIGMDLLRQFDEVTMDYGRKEYRLVMGEDAPPGLRRTGSGRSA